MLKLLQISLASIAAILLLIFEDQVSDFSLFAVILILGIPHGSLDYGIFKMTKKSSSKKKFISKYLLFILAYLLIWIINPFNGLLLFIGLSLYHFGQEHFEDLGLESKDASSFLVHGCFALFVPFFFHYDELTTYVALITSVELPVISSQTGFLISGLFIFLNLVLTGLLVRNHSLSLWMGLERSLLILCLSFIFYVLPLVQGFAIYFILFHSVNAMKHQYQWMKIRLKTYSLSKYLLDLMPFSLLSYVGAALMLVVIPVADLAQAGIFLLVFISLLTMPHLLVFNTFYEEAKKTWT